MTHNTAYRANLARENHDAGIYVGDSPQADLTVVNNRSIGNIGAGVFLRQASHGVVAGNVLRGNCAGAFFLSHGPAPENEDWIVRNNDVRENNAICEGEEEEGEPPMTGVGVLLAGTKDIRVTGNRVRHNVPALDNPFSGGVVLVSTADFGGQHLSANVVRENVVQENEPFDISYDGSGSGNAFAENDCATSQPPSICS